jgi:hypothetical protein
MLEAVAQGSLSEDDERAVIAHAATCAECGPALAAMRARPSTKVKSDREVSIIAPSGVRARGRPSFRAAPGESRLLAWYSVVVTIIAAAAAVLLILVARDRSHLRTANEILAGNQGVYAARLDSMSKALADSEAVVASITGPRVRVVTLTSAGTRSPAARMFWDQATNRWTMFAHFLPTPRQGRAYQLWLVSRGTRIRAGAFVPDANGDAVVRTEYALAADALTGIIVTDEPAGGVAQPTGPTVMSATGK